MTRATQISHGHKDGTNGPYGNRSPSRYRSGRSDTVRDGRFLNTLDKRDDEYMYYSSYGSDTL